MRIILSAVMLMAFSSPAGAAYHDNAGLRSALQAAQKQGGSAFHLQELARDTQDNPIWLMQIGNGDPHAPAVLIVAGADGKHRVGTELALGHVQAMAQDPDTAARLLGKTVYVIPRLNPAAVDSETPLRGERSGSPGVWDLDRDGLTNEDLPDDLNGDGRVSLVRVEHPDGTWIEEGSGDFMRKAKSEAGERGKWLLLSEGKDDDGDEAWNEEADGGVNTARNFPFLFPWFERGAGPYQVSQPESRGVADFLVAHPEVAVVLVYGFEDNLLTPPSEKETSDPDLKQRRWGRKPIEKINKHDQPIVAAMSKLYREALGLPEKAKSLNYGDYGVDYGIGSGTAPTPAEAAQGGLAGYTYYDRGRLTLATPGWTPGMQMALEAAGDTSQAEEAKDQIDPKIKEEEAFRDWLAERVGNGWISWTDTPHPDYPDRRVQVGGYAPQVRLNPPPGELAILSAAHQDFLNKILDRLPHMVIRGASLTALGGGMYKLEATVENAGGLPDVLAQGVRSTHALASRLEIELPSGGSVVGGSARILLDRFEEPGSFQKKEVLLRLPRSTAVTVSVISEMGGSQAMQLAPGQHKEGGQ